MQHHLKPPAPPTTANPSLPPLQVTFVEFIIVAVTTAGAVTVVFPLLIHPKASVIVTFTKPTHKEVAV